MALWDSGVRFVSVDMLEANDLTVGIMALVAQAERGAISRRTKDALAVTKARRVRLGNPKGGESQAFWKERCGAQGGYQCHSHRRQEGIPLVSAGDVAVLPFEKHRRFAP